MSTVRLVVDDVCAPVARSLLAAAGRCLVTPADWRGPHEVVDVDAVTSAGVRTALGVARRGGSLLVRTDPETLPVVVTDLGALGVVTAWVGDADDLPAVARLGTDHVGVLAVLATGGSTADAASRLHLSQRSVERRLTQVRTILVVASVAEAVVEFSRSLAGWRLASQPWSPSIPRRG